MVTDVAMNILLQTLTRMRKELSSEYTLLELVSLAEEALEEIREAEGGGRSWTSWERMADPVPSVEPLFGRDGLVEEDDYA
jgi:hypothetical protein